MRPKQFRSAFVPHDLKAPLVGSPTGPLAGLSVAIKDMYAIAGERVSGGSPVWLAAQSPASTNSSVVDQILGAGGTIIGKTICDEFFYSITGTNHHYGTPVNPRAPTRIPGGSSSGSASACSAGACDIAIGSDTGGSVRVPAALCGLYGIRVTRDRMDLRGAMSMAPSFDAGGWFAASAGLFALAGPVLLRDWKTKSDDVARISVLADAFGHAETKIGDLCHRFLRACGDYLPTMRQITIANGNIDRWREALRVTQAFEVWKSFGDFVAGCDIALDPGIAERMKIAASIEQSQVEKEKATLGEVTLRMESATARQTVLALPTCPSIAPPLGASASELEHFRVSTMRLVCMASISGLPQISIPIGSVDGAPVGLSFIGWRDGEEALFSLAKRIAPFVGAL